MASILDLLFTEQRGGCWTGVIEYAEDGYSLARLAPLCNQTIVRTLMSMPRDYRLKVVFERDLIAATWPELLEIPFNEQVPVSRPRRLYFEGWSSAAKVASRVARITRRARMEPGWLKSKIRGRF
jgi:hypothetical protein